MSRLQSNLIRRQPLERFAKIISELRDGRHCTGEHLAFVLEVSHKTVLRDLDFMRDRLLLPIESSRNGYYLQHEPKLCDLCSRPR